MVCVNIKLMLINEKPLCYKILNLFTPFLTRRKKNQKFVNVRFSVNHEFFFEGLSELNKMNF
jgi:hypothetical protein